VNYSAEATTLIRTSAFNSFSLYKYLFARASNKLKHTQGQKETFDCAKTVSRQK